MASSLLNNALKTIGTFFGNDSDDKNDLATKDMTGVKRSAPPQEPDQVKKGSKRQRLSNISADEQRLFPHFSTSSQQAFQIATPKDEWRMASIKKKPFSGGVQPRNDLRKPGASNPSRTLTPLDTSNSVGSNVYPSKRQKTADDRFQALDGRDQGDTWFDREATGPPSRPPPTLARSSSVVSVHSQSQETSSQNQRFHAREYQNVNRILAPPKKTGRKPKSSGFPERRLSTTRGAESSPVIVDDDDDLQLVGHSALPQTEKKPSIIQKVPTQFQSSPVRPPARHTISDGFGIRAGHAEQEVSEEVTQKNGTPVQTAIDTTSTPRLNDIFVRDTSETREQPQEKTKVRSRMMAHSTTHPPAKLDTINLELSEDELATSKVTVSRSTQKQAAPPKTVRSPSPGDIKSSYFKKKTPESCAIRLKSLLTKSARSESEYLNLVYSAKYKALQFHDKNDLIQVGSNPLNLNSVNARKLFLSSEESNGVLMDGALSRETQGKVWLEFHGRDDRERFLDIIDHMTADKAATRKEVDDGKLNGIYKNTVFLFESKKPSRDVKDWKPPPLESISAKGSIARQRSMAAQQGIFIFEPEPEVPSSSLRRSIMKSDFAHRPVSNSAKFRSPPPEIPMDLPASTRTSRRLQQNESTKQVKESQPKPKKWTDIHGIPQWDAPLIYPATGAKRTTVEKSDIPGLDDGECLNDNLIMYCLRRLEENNTHLKDQVHIFNTYFYTALTTNKTGGKGFNYDAVKRWTKNIDLFTYPYVIVPINQSYHWYLLIICNLDKLERRLKDEDDDVEEIEQPPLPSQEPVQPQDDLEIPESPQPSQEAALSQDVGRMSLAVNNTDNDLPFSGKLKSVARPAEKKTPKFDPDAPTIITLDSLGSPHSADIKYLKQYVSLEGADKRSLEFDYSIVKGVTARGIPQQSNMSDCGVYLIGYITALLKDPREFVRKVLSKEMDKSNAFSDFDPARKRAEIRDQLLELADEQKAMKKAKRKEALLAKTAGEQTPSRSGSGGSKPATPSLRSSPIKVPAVRSSPMPSSALPSSTLKPSILDTEQATHVYRSSNSPVKQQDDNDEMLFNEPPPRIGVSPVNFMAQIGQASLPSQDMGDEDDL